MMGASIFSAAGLQGYVDRLVEEGLVPALSIAVWRDNQLHAAAAGVLNVETGVSASTDTLFQIGSISKVFTATLIMLLVDKQRLDLDEPIKRYLPDFHVADAEATQKITARYLLSHTSGLETDIYADDQWEEGNPIARYVDRCFLLPQVHKDFGKKYSYSNAAYVMAGRLGEVVANMPWAQAIDEYIYQPLGMKLSLSSPLQAPHYKFAKGHMYSFGQNQGWRSAPHSFVPRGMAPAGSALSMAASDLLKFGMAHLNGGKSADGKQWLSEKSVQTMQELQVPMPAATSLFEHGWGVGWGLGDFEGVKAFGHGGGRIGYQALLEIIPAHNLVIAIEGNGMTLGGGPMVRRVMSDLLSEVAGIELIKPPRKIEARDLSRFAGRYGAAGFKFDIEDAQDHLAVELVLDGLSTDKVRFSLRPTANDRFSAYSPTGEYWEGDVVFVDTDARGLPKYLFYGNRLNARVSD